MSSSALWRGYSDFCLDMPSEAACPISPMSLFANNIKSQKQAKIIAQVVNLEYFECNSSTKTVQQAKNFSHAAKSNLGRRKATCQDSTLAIILKEPQVDMRN